MFISICINLLHFFLSFSYIFELNKTQNTGSLSHLLTSVMLCTGSLCYLIAYFIWTGHNILRDTINLKIAFVWKLCTCYIIPTPNGLNQSFSETHLDSSICSGLSHGSTILSPLFPQTTQKVLWRVRVHTGKRVVTESDSEKRLGRSGAKRTHTSFPADPKDLRWSQAVLSFSVYAHH